MNSETRVPTQFDQLTIAQARQIIDELNLTSDDIDPLVDKIPFEIFNPYRIALNNKSREAQQLSINEILDLVTNMALKLDGLANNHLEDVNDNLNQIRAALGLPEYTKLPYSTAESDES